MEPKRSILPNSEADKDTTIRKQSLAMAEAVTNRLHPRSAFATHADWRRVVDGNTILYFDPITNVISSTLPDGYPIEAEEFLYNDFIHSSDSHLNTTVCSINRLFSKVREQLANRRYNGGDNSSRSMSSNAKWRESDSFSQPSVISFRSEGLLHSRLAHEDESEATADIKENAMMFLHDLNQSAYPMTSKRRLNIMSELFDRTSSTSSMLSRRGEDSSSTLSELKYLLFDGRNDFTDSSVEGEEVPPTLTMLSDCIIDWNV